MNKEEKIKHLLCDILREICDAADLTDYVEDADFDATAYIPQFRYMPTFCFTEEDIELVKEIADQECEDFSILTDK